jgi:hypothetical protein
VPEAIVRPTADRFKGPRVPCTYRRTDVTQRALFSPEYRFSEQVPIARASTGLSIRSLCMALLRPGLRCAITVSGSQGGGDRRQRTLFFYKTLDRERESTL